VCVYISKPSEVNVGRLIYIYIYVYMYTYICRYASKPSEVDVGRFLVEADAEAVQLIFDNGQVRHGLGGVEHKEDEVARARTSNHL
jgi:hypothetical protein